MAANGAKRSGLLRRLAVGSAVALVVASVPGGAGAAEERDLSARVVPCTVSGTSGDDVLVGGPGADVLCGRGGDDRLIGGDGRDVLRGGTGADVLRGGDGDDVLLAGVGDDDVQGGSGDDDLRAGAGDDSLLGGPGSDVLSARDAARFRDSLVCGAGESDHAYADPEDVVARSCDHDGPTTTPPPTSAAPTDLALAPATVAEGSPVGTLVGSITVTDPDHAGGHVLALVPGGGSAANGSFRLDGQRLRTAAVLDFEAGASLAVRVRAVDAAGAAYEESLLVTVTDVVENAAPLAVDDTRSIQEDTRLELPVAGAGSPAANDTDADGDGLTVTAVSGAEGGTVALTGTVLRFVPTADRCGPAAGRFDYAVADGRGGSDQGRVSVDITCVEDAAVARDDVATVDEDDPATPLAVLANDEDADGDRLEIASVTQPARGDVVLTGGGTGLTYRPAGGHCTDPGGSPVTFDYTLQPGGSTATVSVTVRCHDDAPVAVADSATTAEDTAATIDVLANDTDTDGGPKRARAVTQPAHGSVVLTNGGADLRYTPAPDHCTTSAGGVPDTFSYTVDGGSTAVVSVTVTCVEDAPVAVDDATTVTEDAAAAPVDVLANDTDVDGGPRSVGSVTQPAHGVVVLAGGDVTYAPAADYCNAPLPAAADRFTYTLGGGSTGRVDVTVVCVDDAAVAVDDTLAVAEDAPATAVAVLGNDTDVDAGPRSIAAVTQPVHGAVVVTGGGSGLTYRPAADYCNTPPGSSRDTFTYTLTGGSTATVRVEVGCVDDAPVAVDDSAAVVVDAPATAIDVLANDTDVDGGPKRVTSVGQPDNGTVVVTGGGSGVTYEPDPSYCNSPGAPGDDTFAYTLDGGSSATVSVVVTCDVLPTAVDDSATTAEDAAAARIDVLANDTDPDSGPRTVTAVGRPGHGTAAVADGGTGVTYLPDADYCNTASGAAPDTFDYTLNGGSSATVSVRVTCVDDAPTAVADTASVAEDSGATAVPVLANDTDVDAGPRTIAAASDPAHGTVALTGGGAGLTYAPDADHCTDGGPADTFSYTLVGGSSATVAVTVTCVNDAPVADDESFSGSASAVGNTTLVVDDPTDAAPAPAGARKTVTGDLLAGDTDVDGPGALVVLPGTVTTDDGGTVLVEADGDFTFTPAAGRGCTDTSDSFGYRVSDGGGGTGTGRVTIAITGCVWYVDNAAAGDAGTSAAPFDTLAQAQAASAAGHTIRVARGDGSTAGHTSGIVLKNGQRLLGELADLQVGTDLLQAGVPGARPAIAASGPDVVTLASANTVRGLALDPAGAAGGIAGSTGDAGGTIDDVRVIDTGAAGTRPAVELSGTSGTFTISGLVVDTSAASGATSGSVGVRLVNAGTVVLDPASTIAVTTAGAKGLEATGTSFGAGSVVDEITVTGSTSGAVSLSGTTGSISLGDGSGTDLALASSGGSEPTFRVSGATGLTVPAAGSATVAGTGVPAVDVVTAPGAVLSFDDVDSVNSVAQGINLVGLQAGTFSAGSGSSVTNATGADVRIDGGSGAVTYDGTVTDPAGPLVQVTGTTGGTKDFNGPVTDNASGNGQGITLTGNTGATVRFDGGVALATGPHPGLVASGGGTVAVTSQVGGLPSTIRTSTGTPLTVTGTAIAGDGLTFERISSHGAAHGIVLTGTGSAGGLAVTGTGSGACTSAATCTGGAIEASTGAGVVLTDTAGTSLNRVFVGNGADDGIRATRVADLDLLDSVVAANGDSHAGGAEERGLDYLDVTGTPQVVRTTVSGSDDANAHLHNTAAGTTTLTVTGSTFTGSRNNAGLRLRGGGPSVLVATVTGSVFSANADPGFSMQTDSANSARQTLRFHDNDVSGGAGTAAPGRPQVSINAGGGAVVTTTVSGNDIKSAAGSEVVLNTLASHTGTFDAVVTGNDIGDAQPGALDPLADAGSGIHGWAHGDGATRMEIRDNTIADWGGRALHLSHDDGNGSADFTVSGNQLTGPDATPNTFEGVYLVAGGVAGDTGDVCVDLRGNAMAGIGRQGVSDVAIDRYGTAQLRFPGFNDTSVPNLQAHLRGANPASPTLTVETFSAGPTPTTATGCSPAQGAP